MKYVLVALGLGMTVATAGLASTPATTTKTQKLKIVMTCPVTGQKIDSVKDAAGYSIYKGTKYYFCCPSCKPMFDANPAKYAK